MTLSDLRLPCEHGEYFEHPDDIWDYHTGHIVQVRECPGGRPATLEDLGGEKVWWCLWENARDPDYCALWKHEGCGWRILIPISDSIGQKVPVPVDWYMAVDGIRVRNDSRWVKLVLHKDGSVTWEEAKER